MTKQRSKKRTATSGARYSAASRLLALRALLATPHGATIERMQEELAVSRHTALRLIAALEEMGEPIETERDARRLVYRLVASSREKATKWSTAHLLALAVARQLVDFLEGTMLKEAFDEVVARLARTLDAKALAELEALERKVLVVQDAPWEAIDRSDVVDALVTSLIKSERVALTTKRAAGSARKFGFEPYTLVLLKKGLYVAGYSHHHRGVRLFALDKIADADWERGERFDVPEGWDARARYGSPFDLFDGPETSVVIAFAPKVARYVLRRRWHDRQHVAEHADGRVVVTLVVRGTTGIASWLLAFGDQAEVLEPASLREELAAVTARMASSYARE